MNNIEKRNWIIYFIILIILLTLAFLEIIPYYKGITASVIYIGIGLPCISVYHIKKFET